MSADLPNDPAAARPGAPASEAVVPREPNDGPAHEGARTHAGTNYGDYTRPGKSVGSPANGKHDEEPIDVNEVFGSDKPKDQGT